MVEFTPHQLETWRAALEVFEPKVVNRAILKFGLSVDPFPDLGKIVIECQQVAAESSGEYAPNRDLSKPTIGTVKAVAKSMGLEI